MKSLGEGHVKLDNQLVTHTTTLLESFRSALVQEKQFARLKEDKIRLEEQLKSSGIVMNEIRQSKTSAEARETHLRGTTDSLMNDLKEFRKEPAAQQSSVDERDMISTWCMKYSMNHDKLTKARDQNDSKEKELHQRADIINELEDRLHASEAKCKAASQGLIVAQEEQCLDRDNLKSLKQIVSEA